MIRTNVLKAGSAGSYVADQQQVDQLNSVTYDALVKRISQSTRAGYVEFDASTFPQQVLQLLEVRSRRSDMSSNVRTSSIYAIARFPERSPQNGCLRERLLDLPRNADIGQQHELLNQTVRLV